MHQCQTTSRAFWEIKWELHTWETSTLIVRVKLWCLLIASLNYQERWVMPSSHCTILARFSLWVLSGFDKSPTNARNRRQAIGARSREWQSRSVNYQRRDLRELPMSRRRPWNIWHAKIWSCRRFTILLCEWVSKRPKWVSSRITGTRRKFPDCNSTKLEMLSKERGELARRRNSSRAAWSVCLWTAPRANGFQMYCVLHSQERIKHSVVWESKKR